MMTRGNLSSQPNAVPSDVLPKYEAITALTDAFCKRHLNEEYATMCRRLAVALARKRPTLLARGRKEVWACGIVRTIGWANVLDDPRQSPYMKLIDIDPEFGVAGSTGQGKSLAIRRILGIGRLNRNWTLPSRLGVNPLVWMVEVNGMLVDIREESRERQEAAFQKGLIPYIPPSRRPDNDHGRQNRQTARDSTARLRRRRAVWRRFGVSQESDEVASPGEPRFLWVSASVATNCCQWFHGIRSPGAIRICSCDGAAARSSSPTDHSPLSHAVTPFASGDYPRAAQYPLLGGRQRAVPRSLYM